MPSSLREPIQGDLHVLHGLGQPWVSHALCEPIAVGDRFYVFCACQQYAVSADTVEGLPQRCGFDQLAADHAAALLEVEQHAAHDRAVLRRQVTKEWRELRQLLRPSAA